MPRSWREPRILGTIAASCAAAWVFVEVADEVIEGDTRAVDTAILTLLRSPGGAPDSQGPAWLQSLARDITALGSLGVLTLLVAASAGFMLLAGHRRAALFAVAATVGGALASSLLKVLFDRPRPDIVPHATEVATASFPSGHAMASAVVYLTLGALLARLVPAPRLKLYIMAVATALAAAIGLTRVYLGVHWPSDVLAGWAAGAAWALACWAVAQGAGSSGAGQR